MRKKYYKPLLEGLKCGKGSPCFFLQKKELAVSLYSAVHREALARSIMASKPVQVLVQYVALRGDLADKWPLGALIAQACHASSAALHLFRDDPSTQNYLADLNSMHKVVLRVSDRVWSLWHYA